MVTKAGGHGIPAQVDHTRAEQVRDLCERISGEHAGRLDILVNDIWGGDALTEWGVPYWEHSLDAGLQMLERAIDTHIITSHFATPLLLRSKSGMIFEITDGKTYDYRGTFFYDLVKVSVMRVAYSMAKDLAPHHVTAIAVTPGFLRSEAMLDHFGVTEKTWRDAIKKDKYFAFSETPHYIGRAIVALAADPKIMEKSGKTLATWDLSEEYGFVDIDGSQPHWQRNYEAEQAKE
jgi:NAD(P)-dependent dehydrogenase (short-subunit alcohol dehydrogenase family)